MGASCGGGERMCEKCVELDQKIEHHKRLISRLMDPQTTARVEPLIADLKAQKAALHQPK